MRPNRHLLRSTPFRLALLFACLFVLAFATGGGIVYKLVADRLSDRLDMALRDTYAVVASTYADSDLEDLIVAVDSYAKLQTGGTEQAFSLTAPDGKQLAGNFRDPAAPDGFSDTAASTFSQHRDHKYRVFSGSVGGNRLVVGRSYAEVEELTEILFASLAWATAAVILIAVGGGTFLGSRAQARIDTIAGTMSEVATGRLDVRIPLTGKGDDVDQVSRQVNTALDRLAALVEGMRQVSSDIAHDLKTPLNRLQLMLESAGDKVTSGADAREAIADAQVEAQGINATFEALLRIAQIEAGARKARFAPVDLGEVLHSIAEIYADVAEDSGKRLVLSDSPAPRGTVHGDRELLVQMFANLVENSIRHCPPRTRIELELRSEPRHLVASVRDDGPGIPREEHENIFRRLYRLDKSRTTPGTGLGLSLVRAIADLHDASIRVTSRSPGLSISIVLPQLAS